jgi:tetratricopeptide (TPR) repeat protein
MTSMADTLQRAGAARAERRFQDAMILLEPLLTVEFPPVGALLIAADCAQLIEPTAGGLRRAEAYLRHALELDPTSVEATLELGHLLRTAEPGPSSALNETIERATLLVEQADVTLTLLRVAVLRDHDDLRGAYELIHAAAARHPGSKLLAQELDLLKDTLHRLTSASHRPANLGRLTP